MTVKKVFTALIILISLCTLMGFIKLSSVGLQITKAASSDIGDQTKNFSRAYPRDDEDQTACVEIETRILASTVRIELLTLALRDGEQKHFSTESHATILGGRYLVTHNHFKYSLTSQVELFGEKSGYAAVSLRDTKGRLLLENEDLSAYTIAYQDGEILVLAFVDEYGQGLFESTNLPSAQFTDRSSISLEEGDELAQIDWDGDSAHVDWVRVQQVVQTDSVPQIRVDNFPLKGSSGGGVFLDGVHIGINWMRNTIMNQVTGEITGRYSIVALNSALLLELGK